MAETSYASCGDLSLAYQLFGDGPIPLVFVGPFVGHVELFWTVPEFKSFFDQLASFCRVAIFDKAGTGLSDPVPKVRTLDDRAAEIEAVMDAVGFDDAVVLAMSEGGPASILFAANRPGRVRTLVAYGSFATMAGCRWEDLDGDPVDIRARSVAEMGDEYAPTVEQVIHFQEQARAVRGQWGSGAAVRCAMPSMGSMRQLGMFERLCASPGMARATFEAAFRIDVRPILPTIAAPTLVIHARDDPAVPVQCSRYLADHISGARWLEVDGVDHAPWFTEADRVLTEIEEFVTGNHAAPHNSHRALRTVLFTDIVASTQHAASNGDERWRAVLQRFGEVTEELSGRFGGVVVKSTGDGHLSTFEGPTHAIRYAEALRSDAETLGIQIRAAIHTGECELLGDDIGGIAVHIAARILGQARAGEILVSRTVRDLVVGSGTSFADRGNVELRGVPGTWQLLAVGDGAGGGSPAGSVEALLAAEPTPAARTATRRADRAVAAVAKRTPWALRGVARLTMSATRR
ncbi:adenylate/guanylate cyclase domain-containing protein [Mycolicibacterium smegmatis]|uniref:Hydrolase, alpha/beta hydrolase fold family protein n=5 Tax=Mycolicibacterium smegmatis TaxID=1772 RepID=A0R0R2_MYCS2|nr:adenylate/guanylate cyclase domain-containing protein [Mycolicibacterium smegmatis]ABK75261.1 hydrolase, alpha/beta hydrolase fold family protein [Mycolicibacterium smegmatis MC2 155]AFP40822.1 Lignin peroxidase LipJ [Mycolicibacterium smegmatis MC2 155]AIU09552.1 cyclase [Mycolicibacterium smegmatis MC2 155]AIU16177.1 cyclase [Mycolicibacterium smegmatis]AIU22800.1 cyclase [Mycolicibacterium smegmatis]